MADGRETKRERREVAKQRRMEELRRRQRKEKMRKYWYAGISVLVIGGIIAGVLFLGQGNKKKVEALNKLVPTAGCSTLQSPADEGNSHQPPYRYRTNPPTSGNHSASTSFTGVLPNPLPAAGPKDENLVHNMEHGAIIIWYKPDLDTSLLDRLKTFVREGATRRIIVPRADMPYALAFTAWTHLVGCENPNDKIVNVADAFAKLYEGNGPEGDRPGTPYSGGS